ncbi:MAG TPA: TetR/AcrR family transcriptional regulator [Streptosporangiaceae bacterium]|jgi:AcrR family transcriptional regulator
MTAGLRERKKRETRQWISDVATTLFTERGFDTVTISDVAQAAGVAKMTVTNYFSRKEDLVFDRADMIIAGLARIVAERRPGESMLAAIRRDFAEAIDRQDPAVGVASPQFAAMVTGSPVLTARGLEIMYLREQALGDAIAAEAGPGETGASETGADDVLHRVIAAQLAAIPRALFAEGLRLSMAGGSRADSLAALARHAERAFALLEPSLGGYGIRKAAAVAGHGMS